MSKVIKFPKPRAGANWFEVKNLTETSADIFIYDEVGEGYFGGGVTATSVIEQVKALGNRSLNVRINSPGGSVFEGVAIYNAFARYPGDVTVHIDGIAASIASIIAMAGKRILMAENAMMMIHNPWSIAAGSSGDFRKQADVLDQIKETLITTYATRTGAERDAIAAMMSEETWMTASEAVALKFADESVAGVKAAACFDLKSYGYVKAPVIDAAANSCPPPNGGNISSSTTPRSLLQRRQALNEKS
jgi:ATP-dependent Clp endopeptidase proteolytic subunit ClpP